MTIPKTITLSQEVPIRDYLIAKLQSKFRSFGGNHDPGNNPIAHALKGQSPQFAMGVDIGEVVDCILEELQ